jgi:AcrR family transcriptional regulator
MATSEALTQADRSRRSTNALLDAAGELIVERGFAALTLATIGERAGFSRGLVTARFGSKDALIEAHLDRIVSQWNHRNVLPQTAACSGLEGVVVILEAIKRQAERDATALKVLYSLMFEAIGPDEGLRSRFAELHKEIRHDFQTLLKKGLKDGSIRKGVDSERESIHIVSSLRGIVYQWLLDPKAFEPVSPMEYLIDDVRARLSSEGGR